MIAAYLIIAVITLQRLIELFYAERNTRALLASGATEVGRTHYPLLVLLHLAWLATITLALPKPLIIHWLFFGVFLMLQVARIWVITTLGPYWTTRIITMPGTPLVKNGPYRFIRHPNYAVVVGEIAVLPLIFGEIWVAIIFSLLNAGVLWWRIRQENAALAPRRVLRSDPA